MIYPQPEQSSNTGAAPPQYPYYQGQPQPPIVSQQPVPQPYQQNAGYMQPPPSQQVVGTGGSSNVVVNVGTTQEKIREIRTWSTGLCSCFEDLESCCCVTFLCPCYTCCSLSSRLGESCCAPVCLTSFGHSTPLVYRTKMRAAHGIMGGAIDDCINAMFCAPCVMCQIKRELDNIERATGRPAFR